MSTAVSMSVSNELQGIGSILGSSEYQRSKTATSLRRTLSADMSSKKWLSKNGFCPLKRIASSEELKVVTDEEDEDDDQDERRSKFQNWNSVPFDDKVKKEKEPPGETDIWSSIVLQKSSSLPTPYVHPLAKRSRSLSQQSLEICTENLGSETGSDGFSSPPSETSDEEQEDEEEKEIASVCKQDTGFSIHSSIPIKKSPPRSFPPPLPSLSQSGLHMRSHRIDGRLVLQAVPVPSHNYFQAQREGGRLLLTLANPKPNVHNTNEENCNGIPEEEEVIFQEDEVGYEQEEGHSDGDDYDEEEEDVESEEEEEVIERSIVLEMKGSESTKNVPTGVINVHRSALMVNKLKLMGLTNIDPSWSPKLEKMVDVDDQTTLVQSLPHPPLVNRRRLIPTTASSFNTYDYCWRTKSAVAPPSPTVCAHPLTQPPINKNNKYLLSRNLSPQEQQQVVLMRGNKADYLVPFFHGCKEPRRSPYVWEPHCIAT